jgi:acetylornithine deacetylase
MPHSVLEAADAGQPLPIARVLVATPSVNPALEPGGVGERAVAEICARWLDGWGFDVAMSEVAPGRFNVLGRLGGGSRTLLLNGHLDTVGVSGMTIEPFGAELRGERLWGRGACDMKGGIACILAASAQLGEEEIDGELLVALTADEEHASIGMQALVEGGLEADAAVVCEPTSLSVMPAHKGFVWTEVVFRGRAAHGSRPEVGIDAIRHAGVFLSMLDDLESLLGSGDPHPLLGYGSIHAGTISGGTAPSVYPGECRVVLERRTLPGEQPHSILTEVMDVLESVRMTVPTLDAEARLDLWRPGTEVGSDSQLVRALAAASEAEGMESTIRPMTAWVDAAWLNEAGIPAVCFGPGDIEAAHTADESVPVAELEMGARVLGRFVREFLGSGP